METIRKRFDTFTNQSVPVLDYYKEKGNAEVVSSVPNPDEVYSDARGLHSSTFQLNLSRI
jgi:adenylate kinase family enzyme